MARKPDAAKAKAAKQKKMLIVLSGVLVLALVYAFMTMRGLNKGSSSAPPPAAAAAATTTTATATPAATPAPGTSAAPALAAASTPAVSSADSAPITLVAAAKPAAATGQLQSFSRFASKDPFDASGPKTEKQSGASGGGSAARTAPRGTGVSASASPSGGGTSTAPAAPQAPPPTFAALAVNGVAGVVTTGTDFPTSTDPTENGLFHLLALTQTTAQVTVVGGSYASGSPTLTLKVNKPVTLVNTADGKRYTLELLPQGTNVVPTGTTATSGSTTAP